MGKGSDIDSGKLTATKDMPKKVRKTLKWLDAWPI